MSNVEKRSSMPSMMAFFPNSRKKDSRSKAKARKLKKSNSLGNINIPFLRKDSMDDSRIIAANEMESLTFDVRKFSNSLTRLKEVFVIDRDGNVRAVAHDYLGQVLYILKTILQRYPTLHTGDVLTAARTLIAKIKNLDNYSKATEWNEIFNAIDQLAIAFSSSVSEYLIIMNQNPLGSNTYRAKSVENILMEPDLCMDPETRYSGIVDLVDQYLLKSEEGVELALERCKCWSFYVEKLCLHIQRRAEAELEYVRNLNKSNNQFKDFLFKKDYFSEYFPFAEDIHSYLNKGEEYCQRSVTIWTQSEKNNQFIEALTKRRQEHDEICAKLKEAWTKAKKPLIDAEALLLKCKTSYYACWQEFDRTAQESQSLSNLAKSEKKKRALEDLRLKVVQAETSYKAAVSDANRVAVSLESLKLDYLQLLRRTQVESERVLRDVLSSLFAALNGLHQTLPDHYQAMSESCLSYEPGGKYEEYVLSLPSKSSSDYYQFEGYSSSRILNGSLESISSPESSGRISLSRVKRSMLPSDSESTTGSSGLSVDASPTSSPYNLLRRRRAHTSDELQEVIETDKNDVPLILRKCIQAIEETGLDCKGIYRLSGVSSKVDSLYEQCMRNQETVDYSEHGPIILTNLVKRYLRESFPGGSIFTSKLEKKFLDATKEADPSSSSSMEQTLLQFVQLIEKMPLLNYRTCQLLFRHLRKIADNEEQTKMNAVNLGIVFGPTVFKTIDDLSLSDTALVCKVVELMITHVDKIFGGNTPGENTFDMSVVSGDKLTVETGLERAGSGSSNSSDHSATTALRRNRERAIEVMGKSVLEVARLSAALPGRHHSAPIKRNSEPVLGGEYVGRTAVETATESSRNQQERTDSKASQPANFQNSSSQIPASDERLSQDQCTPLHPQQRQQRPPYAALSSRSVDDPRFIVVKPILKTLFEPAPSLTPPFTSLPSSGDGPHSESNLARRYRPSIRTTPKLRRRPISKQRALEQDDEITDPQHGDLTKQRSDSAERTSIGSRSERNLNSTASTLTVDSDEHDESIEYDNNNNNDDGDDHENDLVIVSSDSVHSTPSPPSSGSRTPKYV